MHRIQDLDTTGSRVAMPAVTWLQQNADDRKTVTIAGLGDVGRTVVLGLALACGDVVGRIRLYDLQRNQCERMEIEIGQMRDPAGDVVIPTVEIAEEENLFDTDVFLFCVARAVPPVGSGVTDVRMAQYAVNRPIVMSYAEMAGNAGYSGLFGVVSDPVDLLCGAALEAQSHVTEAQACVTEARVCVAEAQARVTEAQACATEAQVCVAEAQERVMEAQACATEAQAYATQTRHAHPMSPYQIQGFGLGVMAGRAAYYAARDPCYAGFLTEGRLYGPHGKDLVVANSTDPNHYDDALSRALTEQVVTANQAVRALGFKPFMAPAISSAALTVRAVLLGKWNYSAQYLGGVYYGAWNRTTADGVEREETEIPDALWERVQTAYENVRAAQEQV